MTHFLNYPLKTIFSRIYKNQIIIYLHTENDAPQQRRKLKHQKVGATTSNKRKRNSSPYSSKKQFKKSTTSLHLKHLLQTHAKNNNPEDHQTKVWMCAFEPDINDPSKTTNIVATCGGDSVCFIDCDTGTVIKKYKQVNEEFYCLSWTILRYRNDLTHEEKTLTILAVGGVSGDVKLIDPEALVCFEHVSYHRKPIDALHFHPIIQHWLFSKSTILRRYIS